MLHVRTTLRQLTVPVQAFVALIENADEEERGNLQLPPEMVRAWLHLVMGLIYSIRDEQECWEQFVVLDSLIRRSIRTTVNSLSQQPLLDKSAVLPLEVVSLMSLNLLHDVTGKYWNISDTYSEFLKALVSLGLKYIVSSLTTLGKRHHKPSHGSVTSTASQYARPGAGRHSKHHPASSRDIQLDPRLAAQCFSTRTSETRGLAS